MENGWWEISVVKATRANPILYNIIMLVSCPKVARKSFQTVARHGWRFSSIGFTTVSRNGPVPGDILSPRQEVLTLVHKVAGFMPVALSLKPDSDSTRYLELWDRILSRVYQDLAAEHVRPTKIVGKYSFITSLPIF